MGADPKSAPPLAATQISTIDRVVPEPLSGRHVRVDVRLGTVVDGRYLIEGVLGEGAMGIVYRARHRLLDQLVAMKVLRPEIARSPEMVERFLHEARIASSVRNPHLVNVTDFGVLPDGATYFVMECLEGVTLTSVLRESGALPLPRILHISKQIARGLAAAHAAGIVHRDLKPDNVMLVKHAEEPDFVKVLDFGIAKGETNLNTSTLAGGICGTPHYMSPEQASGEPVDHHADIYALGVMLYEITTGRVPFDAESVFGVLSMHVSTQPVPLLAASRRKGIPPSFEALVMKCLAKKVADRYSSMEEILEDLETAHDDMVFASVNATPASPPAAVAEKRTEPPILRAQTTEVRVREVSAEAPPASRYPGAQAGATTPPRAHGLVIVVDDSEICREIATLLLSEEGYEVIAIADPANLTDALGATKPELVLIDVTMPGIGGAALIKKIREDFRVGCPLVLYSDLPEPELRELAKACDASGFIRKTADGARFSNQIRTLLRT